MTTDKSKLRMNLTAVKKVDPYANDIIDSSSHVAFYTFNADKNEWEKTDVEGAFFIFSRNAEPRHSIFINNRLNTMSFVEPITSHLELQSQPPFLLYRNERSRIRGFWFYNSDECQRISKLVGNIVQSTKSAQVNMSSDKLTKNVPNQPETLEGGASGGGGGGGSAGNLDIFKMLSKAQQEYNNSQKILKNNKSATSTADNNVMKFFAAAKPNVTTDGNKIQRILPNTLSVEQLEKQQRVRSPQDQQQQQQQQQQKPQQQMQQQHQQQKPLAQCMMNVQQLTAAKAECQVSNENYNKQQAEDTMLSSQLTNFMNAAAANLKSHKTPVPKPSSAVSSDLKKTLLQSISNDSPMAFTSLSTPPPQSANHMNNNNNNNNNNNSLNAMLTQTPTVTPSKPSLMLPTMFEKTSESKPQAVAISSAPSSTTNNGLIVKNRQDPQQLTLNPIQLVQAFNYLLQHDDEFVVKLHDAYIKSISKTLLENY